MSQLVFKKTLSALTEDSLNQNCPVTGVITEIVTHFPPGTKSFVDIRVFHGTKQILPDNGYLALDNASPTFSMNEEVNIGNNIRVEWINADSTFPHTISVIVNIVEK